MIPLLSSASGVPEAALHPLAPVVAERKGIDLATLKAGAKDFLDFLDATKEIFFAYLYHRTGSASVARTLLSEIYVGVLSRSMSIWWLGSLSLATLFERADKLLLDKKLSETDLETLYLPSLTWLSEKERASVGLLHEAVWTLPLKAQRLIILSMLVGFADPRIAEVLFMKPADVAAEMATAKELLLARWQPAAELVPKLQSLVFAPALDIKSETQLRFDMVEKYNSLRMRRVQWVLVGGLFAVLSNVVVASVLAFAVVVTPPTSLRGTRGEVAALDAVLIQRQIAIDTAKRPIAATFKESQRIAAFGVTRDFTSLGLASALESLKSQQIQESEVNSIQKLMQQARTAMIHLREGHLLLAMQDIGAMFR